MLLSNKSYDFLKWLAQYFLPGLATLYFAVSEIWGFPYGKEVMMTIMALDASLGFLLGLGDKEYRSAVRAMGGELVKPSGLTLVSSEKRRVGIIIKLSEKTYDTLMFVTQYVIPSIGTIAVAISGIWGFPDGDKIIGTVAAIDTFLGIFLGISNAQYKEEVATVVAAREALERTSE